MRGFRRDGQTMVSYNLLNPKRPWRGSVLRDGFLWLRSYSQGRERLHASKDKSWMWTMKGRNTLSTLEGRRHTNLSGTEVARYYPACSSLWVTAIQKEALAWVAYCETIHPYSPSWQVQHPSTCPRISGGKRNWAVLAEHFLQLHQGWPSSKENWVAAQSHYHTTDACIVFYFDYYPER
jgi:hypothetical protein